MTTPSTDEMAAAAARAPISLTLIVATTPKLGIGNKGGLPWPPLKGDMSFFRRVTTRPPPPPTTSATSVAAAPKPKNAVIMGRKTWDSIPPRFRPLKGRINVVISRQDGAAASTTNADDEVIVAKSLEEAIQVLGSRTTVLEEGEAAAAVSPRTTPLGRVFVIGGGSIYAAALALPQASRVLLTKLGREYECDTVFPLDLDGEAGRTTGWVRRSRDELAAFVGEEIPADVPEENGVSYEFCLYERT